MAISTTDSPSRTARRKAAAPAAPSIPTPRTGAQIMCDVLEQEGVKVLFGYPGGTIMPFYDALPGSNLRHILVRHEQGAAHAADGYARATGEVGVCVATSGPGATNLVTGLATAQMDSVPLVAITGQVARRLIGTDAFQETDVIGITQPITKHSILVRSVQELAAAMHEAFAIARSGRPGPVVIDVPKDVQQEMYMAPPPFTPAPPQRSTTSTDLVAAAERAAALLAEARRPVILAGHGIILSEAYAELRALAEQTNIPVVTTLLGISAFPESHPLFIGWPGMHGRAEVNLAIHHADVLLAVGMRFDDRVTGDLKHFSPNSQIIHIDIDGSEMGKVLPPTVPMVADARIALRAITERVPAAEHGDWMAQIQEWRADHAPWTDPGEQGDDGLPHPHAILAAIKRATNDGATIVSDVGQHQMWTAALYGYEHANTHISSGGLGTMGFALPAAMGVQMARPNTPVWVIAGDGGIQMNIQEMATLVEYQIPVKIAIFNNGYLGMVRQWQEFFHNKNYSETRITGPDYPLLAAAYGATGMRVTAASEIDAAIDRAMTTDGPVIIDFVIETGANVYPMVPAGKPNTQMIHAPESGRHE